MTDFSQLTAETVPDYLASNPGLSTVLNTGSLRSVEEVGDGNLNLVFIARDADGRALVLKQSLPHVRTDPSWPMTRERSTREATLLAEHHRVDPEHVPSLYAFDPVHYVLAIEDLSDHRVWRRELNEGRIHDYAAAELGRYVARTGFATSVFGLGGPRKRVLVAATANPELSEITEDLVFTEPYIEHEHNRVLAGNEPDVSALRADRELLRRIGLAKLKFADSAQSLLHGDLHTGSVFVREEGRSVRAFDTEFGVYGPTGFDLGAVWGNLVIAAARAEALGERERAERLLELPGELLGAFEAEYRALWPSRVDPRVFGDDVLAEVLAGIRSDAATFAGAKAIRRIVGFAKAADIETLDEDARVGAARAVLQAGRALLVDGEAAAGAAVAGILAEHARH
ncbi:MAG TPA: S-methyl-5-thioribose kinase [Naasia sp.]|jgi:5-methylthioribose kinase